MVVPGLTLKNCNKMKGILIGWNFIRLLRLVLGIAILVQGIVGNDLTSMVLGVLLGGTAVANIGCCGTQGCTINNSTGNRTGSTDKRK